MVLSVEPAETMFTSRHWSFFKKLQSLQHEVTSSEIDDLSGIRPRDHQQRIATAGILTLYSEMLQSNFSPTTQRVTVLSKPRMSTQCPETSVFIGSVTSRVMRVSMRSIQRVTTHGPRFHSIQPSKAGSPMRARAAAAPTTNPGSTDKTRLTIFSSRSSQETLARAPKRAMEKKCAKQALSAASPTPGDSDHVDHIVHIWGPAPLLQTIRAKLS